MKTILGNKKGFMLIEILVALVILGIIMVSFTEVYTSGVSSIFAMGSKTKAVAQAQAVLDAVYQDGELDFTAAGSNISKLDIAGKVTNEADLTSQPYIAGSPIYYSVEEETINSNTYSRVTVMVYYNNGDRYVMLTGLVP